MGKRPVTQLDGIRPPNSSFFVTLNDNSSCVVSAVDFFHLSKLDRRQRLPTAARLADRLIRRNAAILSAAQIECVPEFKSDDVFIRLQARNTIGAIPLVSPTTGKADYGVIVKPRFPWDGIGAMLGQMGWRVAPTPLKFDTFKGSERSIPPWVLSSMILLRISNLLKSLGRRFEVIAENLTAPRGQVRWNEYASRSLPTGQFLSVPCTFPDLRRDRHLLGTIRYCLERVIEGLQSQVEHGAFVNRLIDLAQQLLFDVRDVPIFIPRPTQMEAWLRKPLKTESYVDGMQALLWTIEKRGLAGASKLEGIPWVMEMEAFFEAWIETLFHSIARTTGGIMKVGRLRQTTRPIAWDPPYLGSQKSLMPDIWLQWGSTTLVVDAKYKRHFEELQMRSWGSIEAEWKEQHRNDLLQVLAYANLAESRTIVSCLAYPCTPATWTYLKEAGRLFHKAEITVGPRALHLWLTAAPMKATLDEVVSPIINELMPVLRAGA
jgi:5-methylcytosine-specific restriction endonuclease McrBC regulatory subunit McrC